MTTRTPSPNACQHCGVDEREHMQRWKPPVGWHQWTRPTNDQIKQRARPPHHPEGPLMSTATALHPDAITAKYRTLRDWKDAQNRRMDPDIEGESLTGWSAVRLESGDLMVSARIVGADPPAALLRFETRQATLIAGFGDPDGGDRLPSLDCTVPGRTACVWRTDGVWVEVWHPDTPTPRPTTPVAVPRPVPKPGPPAVTTPSGRLPLGHRLTRIRRNLTKEN